MGSSGPGGTRIRLARPGDTAQIAQLLELVDIRLYPAVSEVIETGPVASTLLLGLDHGADAMQGPLADAIAAGRPEEAMPALVWYWSQKAGTGRCAPSCRPVHPPTSWSMASTAAYRSQPRWRAPPRSPRFGLSPSPRTPAATGSVKR